MAIADIRESVVHCASTGIRRKPPGWDRSMEPEDLS